MKLILLHILFLVLIHCSHQLDSVLSRCNESADIIFILDSSWSIGEENFQTQLSFAANFTGLLRSSSGDFRFGLIQFGSDPQKEISLNEYKEVNALQAAMMNITYIGNDTHTHLALQMILDHRMFSVDNGGRDYAPDIIITLTDGVSNDPDLTEDAANEVKDYGVTMIAVGITEGVNVTELKVLSSKKDYILLASDFTILLSLLAPLLNTTCTAIIESKENMEKDDICQGSQYASGTANLPYPEDCTKVIQCYYNELTGKTLAVIRRCPLGHFWDQQALDCAPSWSVQCPFDRCKRECEAHSPWDNSKVDDDGTMTYPMPGKRRGYYECIGGKSYPLCCPKDYVYVPGIGCYLNRGLSEECGPEESRKEGISICHKIPVWDNRKYYLQTSQVLGRYPASCFYTDFNIVDCGCDDVQTLAENHSNKSSCSPYFQLQPADDCSGEYNDLPGWFPSYKRPITLKITLSLQSPHFQVASFPRSNCRDCYSLKIWGDLDTVNFAMGNKRYGVASQASVLWKIAKGDIDIVVVLQSGRLTFSVSQGLREMVTTVEAFWTSESFQCAYRVMTQSEFKNRCILNKLEVFDCIHNFNNIFIRS